MDLKLRSKVQRLVRMIFQDLFANVYARPDVWHASPPKSVSVGPWTVPMGESNAGTLQLACVGVETFGRVLLGHADEGGISEIAFKEFMRLFFPQRYRGKEAEVYTCYRCGLLHSHYLGFGSQNGFFPTRTGRMLNENHLQYADRSGTRSSPTKTSFCFRLILSVDGFAEDFRQAVETYLAAVERGETRSASAGTSLDLRSNLETSLETFPEDDMDLLAKGDRKADSLTFGDVTVTGTQTSYPLPPPKNTSEES